MRLSRVEKERLSDTQLKIQSAASSLSEVSPAKVPGFDEIQECLRAADRNLRNALRSDGEPA